MITKKLVKAYNDSNCTIKVDVISNMLIISAGEYKLNGNVLGVISEILTTEISNVTKDTYFEVWLTESGVAIRYSEVSEWGKTDVRDEMGNVLEENVLCYQLTNLLGELTDPVDRLAYFVLPANSQLDQAEVYVLEVEVVENEQLSENNTTH